ncbi:MAG TPA: type II toxin-antitoxin system HicB family antitoxin [Anaerolineaceae bacterium]|nr:type II toxin-antitoxin system HicB family antitoxin [Anaerolineaceae bacterium]
MNHSPYQIIINWSEEDEAYVAEVPELPGCMADGSTRQEALVNAEVMIQEWLETAQELGRSIPLPQGNLLTIPEAAEHLGLSTAMLRRYCSSGRLPAQRIGKGWVIRRHDIERFAAAPRRSGRPPKKSARF